MLQQKLDFFQIKISSPKQRFNWQMCSVKLSTKRVRTFLSSLISPLSNAIATTTEVKLLQHLSECQLGIGGKTSFLLHKIVLYYIIGNCTYVLLTERLNTQFCNARSKSLKSYFISKNPVTTVIFNLHRFDQYRSN